MKKLFFMLALSITVLSCKQKDIDNKLYFVEVIDISSGGVQQLEHFLTEEEADKFISTIDTTKNTFLKFDEVQYMLK